MKRWGEERREEEPQKTQSHSHSYVSGKHSDRNECKAEHPKCVNCKGTHDATSKNCPRYLSEREICQIKVDQQISFKEGRIIVSAGQRADASTVRNSQDTMYSGGRNLSDITGSNQNALNKLKSKSNFPLSQLMNSSLPNNNRYSPLQGTLDEDDFRFGTSTHISIINSVTCRVIPTPQSPISPETPS